MPLREQSDAGMPLVFSDPDDPAAQALRQGARGLIALSPIELPVMQAPGAGQRHSLPMAEPALSLREPLAMVDRSAAARKRSPTSV